MGHFIRQCIDLLKDKFPENWEHQFDLHIDPPVDISSPEYVDWKDNQNSKNEEFKKWLQEIENIFFEKLNCSVLVGEYVSEISFIEDIESLDDFLNSNLSPPPVSDPEIQEKLIAQLNNDFISCIKFAIDAYRNLWNEVKYRHDRSEKSYIATRDYEHFQKYTKAKFEENSKKNVDFFYLNLRLAVYDHFLTNDEADLRGLQDIQYDITKNEILSQLRSLLIQKCNFIIIKWILEHEKKSPVFISSRGENRQLTVDSLKVDLSPDFINHIIYARSHYFESVDSDFQIKTTYSTHKNRKLVDCDLQQLHRRIKYFKDKKRDLNNLTSVRKEIEVRYGNLSESDTEHDKYVLSLAYLYAVNNEFSLLLIEKKGEDKVINEFYKFVLDVQNKTCILNFFPQFKYLNYLVQRLKEFSDKKNALNNTSTSRELITIGEKVMEDYEKNIQWSEDNFNYDFLLPIQNSYIAVENTVLQKILVVSSFTIPLSIEGFKKQFSENRRLFNTYKFGVDVFENLESEILDTKNRELRSIEIIGIFTAIVTFVAASVPSFKFIETPYQAMLFMLALSSSLSLFILLITIISRGIERIRKHLKLLIGIFISVVIVWTFFIYCTKDPVLEEVFTKKMEKSIDSATYSQNSKIDSLSKKVANLLDSIEKLKHEKQSIAVLPK